MWVLAGGQRFFRWRPGYPSHRRQEVDGTDQLIQWTEHLATTGQLCCHERAALLSATGQIPLAIDTNIAVV